MCVYVLERLRNGHSPSFHNFFSVFLRLLLLVTFRNGKAKTPQGPTHTAHGEMYLFDFTLLENVPHPLPFSPSLHLLFLSASVDLGQITCRRGSVLGRASQQFPFWSNAGSRLEIFRVCVDAKSGSSIAMVRSLSVVARSPTVRKRWKKKAITNGSLSPPSIGAVTQGQQMDRFGSFAQVLCML